MAGGSDSAITIDLSNYSFASEPGPLALDELTDDELADLLDAVAEAEEEDAGYDDGDDELSDAELAAWVDSLDDDELAALEAEGDGEDPFSEFAATFSNHAASAQARAEAAAEPLARRSEDRVAQVFRHAAAGIYHGQQLDFASEQAAVELAMATGRGNCSAPDSYGRCSARFHELGCSADATAVELASGEPHRYSHGWVKLLGIGSATEAAARGAGMPLEASGLPPHQARVYRKMRSIGHPHERAMAFARRTGARAGAAAAAAGRALGAGEATRVFNQANIYGDPDDEDGPGYLVPASTVELASQLQLAVDWGLDSAPGSPDAAAYADLLRAPSQPVSAEDALMESMGLGAPQAEARPGYPGVSEIRQQLGI